MNNDWMQALVLMHMFTMNQKAKRDREREEYYD